MQQQGYIKLHRKFLDWEWYSDLKTSRLFLHCLLSANHTQKTWQGINIKRGEFLTSLESLAKQTGLTISEVRLRLKKLKTTNSLTYKPTNKYTIISITYYDDYQGDDKQNDKQTTNKRQTNNKQTTTTNNDKNDKTENNDKEKNIIINNNIKKPVAISLDDFLREKHKNDNCTSVYNCEDYMPDDFEAEYLKRIPLDNQDLWFHWGNFTRYWTSADAKKSKMRDWKKTWINFIEFNNKKLGGLNG